MTNIEKMLIEALKQVDLEREQDRKARKALEEQVAGLKAQVEKLEPLLNKSALLCKELRDDYEKLQSQISKSNLETTGALERLIKQLPKLPTTGKS